MKQLSKSERKLQLSRYRIETLKPIIDLLSQEIIERLSNPEEFANLKTSQLLYYLHLLISVFPTDKVSQAIPLSMINIFNSQPKVMDKVKEKEWIEALGEEAREDS